MENILLVYGLTGRCNLSCSYCIAKPSDSEPEPDMPVETVQKSYDRIRQMHPESFLEILCLGKGEPLLNWPAIEKIDQIKENDNEVYCAVTTNGTLQERVLELARRDRWMIQISFDGIDNNLHRGSTELVEDTLRKLKTVENARYIVRMTVTRDNIPNLKESLKYIYELGVEFVSLGPAIPLGKYGEKIYEPNSFDFKAFADCIFFAREIGLKPLASIQEPCNLAIGGYYVLPDGRLSMCYLKDIEPQESLRTKAKEEGCLLFDLRGFNKK